MPQPIDLQTEVARVTQAERVQQVLDRVSLAAQQRMAAATQEDRIHVETEVQQTHTTADQVEAEARRRNPYVKRRRRRSTASDADEKGPNASAVFYNAEEKQEVADDSEGTTLDVSI